MLDHPKKPPNADKEATSSPNLGQDPNVDFKEFTTSRGNHYRDVCSPRSVLPRAASVLCNPKFICKNNRHFSLSSTYFLYLLTSLPKMVKQEMPASAEQS